MSRCPDCVALSRACDGCAEEQARQAWERYCRGGHKPVHLPARPDLVYADAWRGWREWVLWAMAEPRPRFGFELAILGAGLSTSAWAGCASRRSPGRSS